MTENAYKRSEICEALVTLYLRLNGYFTTGLIVHSACHGNVLTEIDCLAVRHPHHSQDDREVPSAQFLCVNDPSMIDLVICEVKSNPEQVKFNGSIQKDDLIALSYILNWAGVFEKEQIKSVADRLRRLLADEVSSDVAREGIVEGRARVRALLCCPSQIEENVNSWRLTSAEIFRCAKECLLPPAPHAKCSVVYDFELWPKPLETIVRWFKDRKAEDPLTLAALYKHLKI